MTIAGPLYTTASENLALDTRMASQRFLVSGGNRGLESVTARLWRLSNLQTPNLIGDPSFATDPFDAVGQVWEAWGGPVPTWSAGFVQFVVGVGTAYFAAPKIIRTQVKNRKGTNLTLQPGDSLALTVSITSDTIRNFILKLYDGTGQVITSTVALPADSVSHDYTLTGSATAWWRAVYLELATEDNSTGTTNTRVTNVSLKHQAQLINPVRCSIYEDEAGLPGARLAQSATTYIPHSGLTNAAADYSFSFPDNPLLLDGNYYHILVYVDAPDLETYYDDIANGQMVWAIWDSAGASYADGEYADWVYGNTAGVWTASSGADLYFKVFYTDAVPAAPDYPITTEWPCDCADQATVIADALDIIDTRLNADLADIQPLQEANVNEEPGYGLWGTRWIKDGGSLPLPDWMNLLWRKKDLGLFGGQFTSYNNTVARMERKDWPRSIYTLSSPGPNVSGTFQSTNVNTSTVRATWSVLVKYPSYLYFQFLLFSNIVAALNDIRWTYWINGVNIYRQEVFSGGTPQNDHGYDLTAPVPGTFPTTAGNYNRKVLHPYLLQPATYSLVITVWTPSAGANGNNLKAGPFVADGSHGSVNSNMIMELIRA